MMKAVVGAAFLAVAAVSAEAATFKAVYTGTVGFSLNETGEFGSDERFGLSGLDFILSFIYDPDVGQQVSDAISRGVQGGSALSPPSLSPIISSSLTINGVTRSLDGSYFGNVFVRQTDPDAVVGANTDSVGHTAQSAGNATGNEFSYSVSAALNGDLGVPLSLTTPFSLISTVDDFADGGTFQFFRREDGETVENVVGFFLVETLTVSALDDVAPIPLPAGLPLLAAALGGLAVLRRRRV